MKDKINTIMIIKDLPAVRSKIKVYSNTMIMIMIIPISSLIFKKMENRCGFFPRLLGVDESCVVRLYRPK